MNRSYKYKLNPNKSQKKILEQTFGCCRYVYNWGLNYTNKHYEETGKHLYYIDLSKKLTAIKEEQPFLKEVSAVALQQSLRNLESAFTQYFQKRNNVPIFKTKKSKQSVQYATTSIHFDFNKWKVKVPCIGWIKIFKNKSFDLATCKIGQLTVSKDKCGDYWCAIKVETSNSFPTKAKLDKEKSIGIDLGIKDYAVFSNGLKISNPKFFEKDLQKIQRLQRKVNKKIIGSNNRQKALMKANRQYRKMANRQNNFIHQLTTKLIKSEYDTFCIEDLSVQEFIQTKDKHLSRLIMYAGWYKFRAYLKYKCDWYGKNLLIINKFDPSSKTCHNCGYINKDLKLTDRFWTCPNCGKILDRDINAAINIKNMAFKEYCPDDAGCTDCGGYQVTGPMKQ